ncbi:hypothetical protein [Echinimonas agarilytica]|uniref:Uncharacterized protein n=1 Tax=Echinimonas agarilytica TaxID=1215918 RepID=A0AA41W8B8_9GAMM|nr:hypothetical protein [Echinimonas agarilytica]MCM2680716.1 hypothetical protein [Echinimonas agarilytica]
MKNFKYKRKEVEFWSITGEILSQNKYSETHVHSSGGGGYVGKDGGHVSPPNVHSNTITNHEFWIKKSDGSEKSIQLSGHDIPLRPGQRITIISAGMKGKDSGYYSVLVNHHANEHWFLNKAEALNKQLKIYQATGKSILIAGALWWAIAQVSSRQLSDITAYSLSAGYSGLSTLLSADAANNILNPIWRAVSNPEPVMFGFCVAAGFIVLRLIIKIPRILKMHKMLNLHLESLAQACYKKA